MKIKIQVIMDERDELKAKLKDGGAEGLAQQVCLFLNFFSVNLFFCFEGKAQGRRCRRLSPICVLETLVVKSRDTSSKDTTVPKAEPNMCVRDTSSKE